MNKRQRKKNLTKSRIKLGINPKTGLIDEPNWGNDLNGYKGGSVWGWLDLREVPGFENVIIHKGNNIDKPREIVANYDKKEQVGIISPKYMHIFK